MGLAAKKFVFLQDMLLTSSWLERESCGDVDMMRKYRLSTRSATTERDTKRVVGTKVHASNSRLCFFTATTDKKAALPMLVKYKNTSPAPTVRLLIS